MIIEQPDGDVPARAGTNRQIPQEFTRALAAFARHDAAAQRHIELLARLRAAQIENAHLRSSGTRLREHMVCARAEMEALSAAAERYTRAMKAGGVAPEGALVAVRSAVHQVVSELPELDRPTDTAGLATTLVDSAIRAYYAA